MRTFTIQNSKDQAEVSKLMFGTTYLGYARPSDAYCQMDQYYEMGGRTIDTARVYSLFEPGDDRPAEAAVGEWLTRTGLRSKLLISTKGGHPPMNDMHHPRLSYEELSSDLGKSLEALQTDYVDVYWLHRDDLNRPVAEIMETLHDFVKQGMVRFLGASNWTVERIREANDYANAHGLTPFSASQIQWSYAKTDLKAMGDDTLIIMDEATHRAYLDMNLPVFAFESQAKGLFSKMAQMPADQLPQKVRDRFLNDRFRAENEARFQTVKRLAETYGVSPTVIALAYITCNPLPAGAILGCSNLVQWQDSLAAQDFVLPFEVFGE